MPFIGSKIVPESSPPTAIGGVTEQPQPIQPLPGVQVLDGFFHNTREPIQPSPDAEIVEVEQYIGAGKVAFDQLTVNKFFANENMESSNFVSGSAGWQIKGNGDAEFQSVTIAGVLLETNGSYGGDGADGAVSGALTVTGSNDTYIEKNYTTFAPGSNTVTVTPTGCILHIKVNGNCDLTNTTFNFTGKGGPGGAGGVVGNDGTDGSPPLRKILLPQFSGSSNTGGNGQAANDANTGKGCTYDPAVFDMENFIETERRAYAMGGHGGGGGGGSSFSIDGGAGGGGGGCLILEVAGDLTFSSTTMNFDGVDGTAGVTGAAGESSGGGGGGGGGGCLVILYKGTLSGSPTTDVTAGAAGAGGGDSGGGGSGGSGGGGGVGMNAAGSNGVDAVNPAGGAGGAGGAGLYFIAQVDWLSSA